MTLAAESHVLLRNIELLTGSRILLINPPQDQFIEQLNHDSQSHSLSVFTTNFANKRFFENKADVMFSWKLSSEQAFDTIVLYYPKAKQEAKRLLAEALSCVAINGHILVIGENKTGVKTIVKLASDYDLSTTKVDSAKHCSLFELCTETPSSIDIDATLETTYEIDIAGEKVQLASIAGVFNHGALDDGTKVLLENLPTKLKAKKVLDFGCGCGVIGNVIAKKCAPTKLDMVDVSALAIESSQRTCEANQVSANVFASDGLSEVKDRYDLIISNPPFHSGIHTHYDTTENFIKQASRHLLPRGKLIIVANSFLKYQPIMEKHFSFVNLLFKNTKFAVYEATFMPKRGG